MLCSQIIIIFFTISNINKSINFIKLDGKHIYFTIIVFLTINSIFMNNCYLYEQEKRQNM